MLINKNVFYLIYEKSLKLNHTMKMKSVFADIINNNYDSNNNDSNTNSSRGRCGGLMSLIAYRTQDVYLTANPEVTFFKIAYKRHTNFSMKPLDF